MALASRFAVVLVVALVAPVSARTETASAARCTSSGTDGNDVLVGTPGADVLCGLGGNDVLRGGGGADSLHGGSGNDRLVGGPGNDGLRGGGGDDQMFGGPGHDHMRGGTGADVFDGGRGIDLASYAGSRVPVIVSVGLGANDGAAGEGDDVRSGVERVMGGTRGDRLTGDGDVNRLWGLGGADLLRGGSGNNVLLGGLGADQLLGQGGDDQLFGGRGGDTVLGGAGNDRMNGGAADDTLDARDAPGFVDRLACGPGNDTAFADPADILSSGCEDVPTNAAPTDITLSNASVDENEPAGTPVGTLAAVDPNVSDTHTFALAAGAGDGDNASFAIDGTTLETDASFDHETDDSLSIRVRVTDNHGASFAKALTISVTDVGEGPTAADDTATVAEDAAATAIDVLANDTDPEDDPITIASSTQPANGTVVVTGGGTGLTYEPNDNYCNDPPGTTADTFTYTIDGGDSATVSVTVRCVDDDPVAVDDAATVGEDADATAIDVLANDSDVDGGPKSIDTVTQPGNGTVVRAPDGSGLTYEPADNFCSATPDSFDYTLSPGGDTATVSVTVSCLNDPPVAVADTFTTDEDTRLDLPVSGMGSPAANDTDIDGGPLQVTAVADPTGGSVAIVGAEIRFTPAANVCDPVVGGFDYTVSDGQGGTDTGRVTVNITCVDDPPDAIDDAATVAEDAAATGILVLGNDVDIDGGPMTIASATQPADGTVIVAGDGTGLTYQPDANHCNSEPGGSADTFTYTLNGGSEATVSMTVTCINDLPVAVDDTFVTDEDVRLDLPTSGAGSPAANDSDVDNDPLAVTAVTNPTGGTVSIVGDEIQFTPTLNLCAPVAAGFDYTVSDGQGGSDTGHVDVTVTCVDDPPDAVDDAATVGEDATATPIAVLANDVDLDGGPMAINAVSQPDNGAVVITGGGTGLTYQPDANYCNDPPGTDPDTFSYTLNGGDSASVSMTVTCVSDAPIAVNDAATVLEDATATAIDVLANDDDPDGDAITIQSASDPANGVVVVAGDGSDLTYQPDPNYCNDPPGTAPDTFTYTVNGGDSATVSVTVTCVPDDPIAVDDTATLLEDAAATAVDVLANDTDPDGGPKSIATVTQPVNGTVVTTGGGSGLTYQPDANYCNSQPGGSADTFDYTLTPGGSTATVSVTVTCVDDPPTAIDDSSTVLEDAAATAVNVLANDTDIDGGPKTVQSVTQPANGTVVVTGGGTGLTYQPNPNYCNDPPGTTPDTFTYTLNGGDQGAVAMTVTCVNDAPVADDETFDGANSAVGNTTFVGNDPDDGAPAPGHLHKLITGDILAGDNDIDGPGPLVVQAGTFATNDGGSVTIQADGDFTYTPAAGLSCTDASDFFEYTVTDQHTPTASTDVGRVTIAITGCVWYVSNNAAGNTGTSSAPFDTLAQADTASGAGHTIFVFDGDGTTTGYSQGIDLAADQRLIGEAATLVIGTDTLHTGVPANRPTITDNNADVVVLDDRNTVSGVEIDPQGTGGGIAGGTGDDSGTISNVRIVESGTVGTQPGLELNGTTGTFNVSDLTVTNNATGVLLNSAGTVNFAAAGTISVTSTGAKGLDAAGPGTSMGSSTFDSIIVTGSGNGGVSLTNTTGSTTFTDLSLTTTSGTGFVLSNAGAVTVSAAGIANVNASGGPAVDVTGTSGATLAFDDVSSTNSTGDGINLAGLGAGTFSASSGTIAGAAGIAFDLDGGNGTITYPGSLNNGSGASAEITGRTGGAVTLSGPIADTNDAGGGITVSANTGGSTTFGNASKVLNTGTSAAVSFTSSDGHTLNLTGGGLDLDTTSGQGVLATNSGTITVTGSGNTVASTTGRAVQVQSTDFGAGGFTFQSASSNGAPNGILLSSTGTAAGMTITGTGANNSGGSIQNATEHGISLTTTNNFSADELSITGANFAGVDGTDVTNFTFTDGEILNAGDSLSNPLHGSIAFNDQAANENNVDGVLIITGNLLKDHYGGGVDVFNRSGTISDATVSSNTIDSPADEALSKEDAISFNLFGSATTVASLTKAQIEDNIITDHPSGNGITILGAQTNTGGAPTPTIGVPGSSTNRILIDGNLLTGDPTLRFGGSAIQAGVEGRGVGNFDITNNGTAANPITNAGTHGIATGNSGSSEVEYLIQNNRVSANNFEGGGLGIRSASDRHIMADGSTLATPILKTIIADNVVRNTTGGGIRVLAANSNGTSEVKVTNNDVANGGAGSFAIRVENGSSADAAFDPTMCATISGNVTAANAPTPGGNTAPGIGLFKRSTAAADYQFGIVGLTPSPSTNANTETFVTGQNPASNLGGGFWAGKRVTVDAGDNFVSCTHPPGF